MKIRTRWWVPLVFALVATAACADDGAARAMRDRARLPGLRDTIFSALAYLEDTQIRNRPGKGPLLCDSAEEGDGCKNQMMLNLPFRENIGIPAPPPMQARNRSGEWASQVHFLPKKMGLKGRDFFAVQDTNLFMTAFIGYPLFLFDESALPPGHQFLANMLRLAMKNVESFRRGDAYNFWAELPGVRGSTPRTGPLNIPVQMIEKLASAYLNPRFKGFFAFLCRGQQVPPPFWIEACLDREGNPTGADALFNIPNDADDTATAVAFQYLFAKRFPRDGVTPDRHALSLIQNYRDLDRTKEDGRDTWKGKNTGAFLTWMKDENRPTFEHPEEGVVPLAVNNVDAVVNCNAAFSVALNGLKNLPGYRDSLRLIVAAIRRKTWPEAGLYYPQNMIFPYAASRAFRDGGAREEGMDEAMGKLLADLLALQRDWARRFPDHAGAFPGGEDRSDHLATALGVTSLLNIGRDRASQAGLKEEFDQALQAGVAYLLKVKKLRSPINSSTGARFATKDGKVAIWDSGLFFSASYWDLGHWRSQAFTTAMVLEALTKFALAYDLDQSAFGARRIQLRPNPPSPGRP